MKERMLTLLVGILMFITTTALLGAVIYFCDPSGFMVILLCAISGLGYTSSFLLIVNYIMWKI